MIKVQVQRIKSQLVQGTLGSLVKGSAVTILIKLFGTAVLYGLAWYITNTWNAGIYGDFVLFLSTLRILSIFTVFGMDTHLLRNIGEADVKDNFSAIRRLTNNAYVSSFLMVLVVTGAVALTFLLFREYLAPYKNLAWLVLICLLPLSLTKLHIQALRGSGQVAKFAWYAFLVTPLFALIGLILLGSSGRSVDSAITNNVPILVYASAVTLIGLSSTLRWEWFMWANRASEVSGEAYRVAVRSIKRTLKQGAPFLLATSSFLIAGWTTHLFLKIFQSSADVGLYDVIFKIGQLVTLPLMGINTVIAPRLSRMFTQGNIRGLETESRRASFLMVITAIPIILLIFFLPGVALGFFGDEFTSGAMALRVILIAHFVNTITGPLGLLLQMTNHEKIYGRIILITTGLNVALSFLLIPTYGVLGATINYTVYIVVNSLTCLYFIDRKLKINPVPFWSPRT